MSRLSTIAVALLVLIAAPMTADAQYFGRNKVEYADFDFRVLTTDHFDIYYYPREARAARLAAQLAERWYARFARVLGHELDGRQPVVLYGSQSEFAQTNVVSGLLSDTIGGVTEPAKRRIAMPFAPTLAETDHVLGHEIVHAFQFDIARRHGGSGGQPLWFIEGMAEYLARGPIDAEANVWLRDAVTAKRLPQRQRDAADHLSPYQYGYAFWSYLAERYGDEVVQKALKPGKGKQRTLDGRMRHATGQGIDALFSDWRKAVVAARRPDTSRADGGGARLLSKHAFGRMQLGPAVSPDGRYAVFFSERDRFALDLFLGDIETGRVVRKLATTTASARFDSLQPVRAAGAWSPDGDWFVFPVVRTGHAALLLLDMRHPGRDREIPLSDLGQVLSPAWSPDGKAIAFSALAGGFSDLYVYDLTTRQVRQLTDDPFADLHPAWSPDGSAIAFATDRFSSNLSSFGFGPTELATIDVASGAMHVVAALAGAAHINPQWSPDGRQLYFVANPDGIANVFRLDRDEGTLHQVTDVETGVGGLTPTSPAISLASHAPVLAFTLYRNGRYQLDIVDGSESIAGKPGGREQPTVDRVVATSPNAGSVAALLADSQIGLPDPSTLTSRVYAPRLSLERIGQPYISSGGGALGTFVRGGGSLLFGDMLGERRLGAAVQIGNRLRDTAFQVRYLNQERRWNWGAIAELEPALHRYRRSESIEQAGQPAIFKQVDYLQRVQLRTAGLLAYPFSRGLRIELTGGMRHARYQHDVRSQVLSAATGRVLDENRIEASGGQPTTVAEVGGALVGDTTIFGPTGPLLGTRYRFEVAPAMGDLTYTRVLADYRRYVMPVRPYTLALRVLHSDRYGRDGDDPRLPPSFLGSRSLVRGHRLDTRQCEPNPNRPCGAELLGHRLLVTNLELRFPIWGVLSRQIEYGPLPADAFVFADGGLIWPASSMPLAADPGALSATGPLRRTRISSVGAGIRVNAGGLPFEVAAVRAVEGPARGWSFDFGFQVGF